MLVMSLDYNYTNIAERQSAPDGHSRASVKNSNEISKFHIGAAQKVSKRGAAACRLLNDAACMVIQYLIRESSFDPNFDAIRNRIQSRLAASEKLWEDGVHVLKK